jgi:hypothetical protein
MTQEPDREGSALKGSRVQGADRSATGASAAGAVKHWLVLGRDPDDSTFIVWDEQTADDHRETGYRVDGPFVPLAVAEKLAQALVPFVSLHNMASAFGSLTDEEFARLRVRTLLKAEAAADALAEFRAAHPREETP